MSTKAIIGGHKYLLEFVLVFHHDRGHGDQTQVGQVDDRLSLWPSI